MKASHVLRIAGLMLVCTAADKAAACDGRDPIYGGYIDNCGGDEPIRGPVSNCDGRDPIYGGFTCNGNDPIYGG